MKISDKLDSQLVVSKAIGLSRFEQIKHSLLVLSRVEPAWWAVREQWRLEEGYHEVTDALELVNKHAKVFAHISKTDRTKVAFTPDKSFGERDAQLQMNFGKFVQRVIPFASDEYVKTLTESHVADLSNEVEWIEGAEIEKVYIEGSVGTCMSKSVSHWHQYGLPKNTTPAVAYAAPGIKMAVLRDSEGRINARCMVYEDGDDKRLIRAHGDGALYKRLTRLGYKHGGWQGVKFNTVKWTNSADADGYFRVVVPYLDAMNRGCDTANCTVMLLDGQLIGVKAKNIEGLRATGVAMTVPGTSGYVTLKNTSAKDFIVDDILTNEKINILTQDATKVAVLGGNYGITASLDRNTVDNYVICYVLVDGKLINGYKANVEHTFMWDYSRYIESDAMRRHLGFNKLSPEYYTEGLDIWLRNLVLITEDGVTHYIKSEDAVKYYTAEQRAYVHKSKLPKKAIKLASIEGKVWYAEPGTEVLRTPSKAKVVLGLHDVTMGWQGVDYSRNLNTYTTIFGSRVYHKRADRSKPELLDYLRQKAKADLEVAYKSGESLQRFFSALAPDRRYVYPTSGNKFFRSEVYVSSVDNMSIPEFKEFLEDYKKCTNSVSSQATADFCMTKIAEMEAINGEEPNLNLETEELETA
jgi:hypothetical protein